ncbi:hypothetical protein ACFLEY_02190 [Bradyrhizobium sp. YCK136]|uniref:hypothetical protein n=1 Tax=Bradyrhizobium sp. YCK136 TaxID=3351346 RepID=UPI0037C6C518
MMKRIDFGAVNAVALPALLLILQRWLPDGKRQGCEFVAKNPTRADRNLGSFSINLVNGKWADFATGDRGVGVVSLAAYLFHLTPPEAARLVAAMLGISEGQK